MTPIKATSPPRRTPAPSAVTGERPRPGHGERRHRVRAGHAVKIASVLGSGHARPRERAALDRASRARPLDGRAHGQRKRPDVANGRADRRTVAGARVPSASRSRLAGKIGRRKGTGSRSCREARQARRRHRRTSAPWARRTSAPSARIHVGTASAPVMP